MVSQPKHIGTVKIGSESYLLAETDERQAWEVQYLHEPPWADGVPPMLSRPQETWHLGGLKSVEGFPGTSEYGQNTDTRWPFRLLSGAQVLGLALVGGTDPPTRFFEALGYLWVVAGRHIFRIDPSDNSVVDSKDLGAGVLGIDGIKWEDDTGLVATDAADQSLWEVTAVGTPDAWAQAASGVKPYRLAAGIDRLYGIEDSGLLRNVVSGDDPMVAASWADEVQCGDVSTKPTGLVAFEKTVLAGKPEGLFGASPEGKGVPLIKRMPRDDDNCLGMMMHEPHAFIPHARGLYRFLPGLVESSGLEREIINTSPIRGRFKALVSDGQWLWGLINVSGGTYIMVARDRSSREPGFGPLVWDTFGWMEDPSQAIHVSALWNPPQLWFGKDDNVGYYKLSTGAGAPDVGGASYIYSVSATRYTNKYNFGDWGPKDFPKVVVVGKNLDSTTYWEVYYSVDGVAFSKLDIDGNDMKVASGRQTFFLPTTASGREIQFYLKYTTDDASQAGEIVYFEPFAVPQSRKIPLNVIQLHLARGVRLDVGHEARSAEEQLSDLTTLDETAAPLVASGPWGEDKNMWMKHLRLVKVIHEPDSEPEYLVEVALQERKVS